MPAHRGGEGPPRQGVRPDEVPDPIDTAAAKFDETASEKHVPCRYLDGGDGTITDTTTGLMWQVLTEDEQVTGHGWYEAMGDHVSSCNGWSPDGTSLYPVCATYSDWRVPTVVELASIVDLDAQGCGFGGPCIDPIFGPTYAGFAWSSTTDSTKFDAARGYMFKWCVDFRDGSLRSIPLESSGPNLLPVRAVRSAL